MPRARARHSPIAYETPSDDPLDTDVLNRVKLQSQSMDTITLNKPHDHTLATRAGWPMGDDWNAMIFSANTHARDVSPLHRRWSLHGRSLIAGPRSRCQCALNECPDLHHVH